MLRVVRSSSRSGGFTMVELSVTVALMAILLAIAAPSMTGMIRDARISTQADLLVSTLNSARLEAIKQRTDMTVCPLANPDADVACSNAAADWSAGFGIWDVGDATAIPPRPASIIQRVQAKGDATVTNAALSVTFNRTLGSAAAASAFVLCVSGKKQRTVSVGLSGHVSKTLDVVDCP